MRKKKLRRMIRALRMQLRDVRNDAGAHYARYETEIDREKRLRQAVQVIQMDQARDMNMTNARLARLVARVADLEASGRVLGAKFAETAPPFLAREEAGHDTIP